jgi:hypothetical protein
MHNFYDIIDILEASQIANNARDKYDPEFVYSTTNKNFQIAYNACLRVLGEEGVNADHSVVKEAITAFLEYDYD